MNFVILLMMVPYQILYIYEIAGEISGSRGLFKKDFIGCWNEGEVSFLFFSRPKDEEVETLIGQKGFRLLSKNVLDYKTWQSGEELKPFQVGNLFTCPPWQNCVIGEGEISVHLDPCVVFGTGSHPTTLSCFSQIGLAGSIFL